VLIYYCDFASVEVVIKNYLLTSLLTLRLPLRPTSYPLLQKASIGGLLTSHLLAVHLPGVRHVDRRYTNCTSSRYFIVHACCIAIGFKDRTTGSVSIPLKSFARVSFARQYFREMQFGTKRFRAMCCVTSK